MEKAVEKVERIGALADALYVANLEGNSGAMEPKSVREIADLIKGLADGALKDLQGLS